MADIVGFKALDQIHGSTDIMYTDRRVFYLRNNYLANMWETVTPFLNFAAQVQTFNDSPDPDYKLFESRPFWVDNFKATYGATTSTSSVALSAGTARTGVRLNTSSLDETKVGTVGTVCEVWDANETTKRAVGVITVVAQSTTYDAVTFIPIWVNGSQSLTATDVFYAIGDAQEEGSTSPEARSDDLSIIWNSAQIFETPVEMTDVAKKAKLRPVNEWQRLVMEASKAHKIQGERAIIMGARRGDTGSAADLTGRPEHVTGAAGHYIRTTAGFIQILDEDYDISGTTADRLFNINMATYTWADFVDDIKDIYYFQENQTPLYMFHGANVSAFFDKAAAGGFFGGNERITLGPTEEDAFGFKIRRLYTTEGEIRLVRTPVLRGRYAGYGMVVDPRYVGIVKYEADRYKTNIQANDAKRRKDEYFSDFGFYLNLVEKHALMKFS